VSVALPPRVRDDMRPGPSWRDHAAAADGTLPKTRIIRRRMTNHEDDAAVRPPMLRHAIRTMEPLYHVAVAARRFHRYAMTLPREQGVRRARCTFMYSIYYPFIWRCSASQ